MKIKMKKEWLGALIILTILTMVLVFRPQSPVVPKALVVEENQQVTTIEVYINGAVVKPGVYSLDQGQRLNVLLEKAGGFLETAEQKQVNLARRLEDGEMVWIYEKTQETTAYVGVDFFNYSDEKALTTIDGIGAATAKRILDYRLENGNFASFEDLLKVEGIGPQKLKGIQAQFPDL